MWRRSLLIALLMSPLLAAVAVTAAGQRTLLQNACLSATTLVVYAGSGGRPDLAQVAAALPLDKTSLLPLGPGQAVLLDLEAPVCDLRTVSSLPGSLLLFDNGTLPAALPAVSSIGAVGGTLMVYGHAGLDTAGLKSLKGLSNMRSASNLLLYNLDALTDLQGLEGFQQLPGDLILANNARLRTLRGLDGLTSIGGDLALLSNMLLSSVVGLQNLASVGGQILAKGNGKLVDLLPLKSLTSLGGGVREVNNGDARLELPASLRQGRGTASAATAATAATATGAIAADTAAGAPAPQQAAVSAAVPNGGERGSSRSSRRVQADESVVVLYSGSPPDLKYVNEWLEEYDTAVERFDIRDYNSRLINMYGDDGAAKQLSDVSGSLVIWSNKDLGRGLWPLSGLRAVYGQLVVVGSPDGSTELETLEGLDNLKYVGGLHLLSLKRLRDLKGLGGLTDVLGDINIMFCLSLESTRGLGPMAAVYSDVHLEDNPSLWDLSGFKSIRSIGWNLHLQGLPSLGSLDGLAAVETVYGELVVKACPKLASLSGLSSLNRVGTSVALLWNDALNDLSVLSRLGGLAADLQVTGNPSLTSLGALSALKFTGLNLVVSNNNALRDLSGLDALGRVGAVLSIRENDSLKSLAGLGALTDVGERLFIGSNWQLTSLADLDGSLQRVGSGGIAILNNPSLKTLGRLPETLQRCWGNVLVEGPVSSEEIGALQAKGSRDGGSSASVKK